MRASRKSSVVAVAKYSQWPLRRRSRKSLIGLRVALRSDGSPSQAEYSNFLLKNDSSARTASSGVLSASFNSAAIWAKAGFSAGETCKSSPPGGSSTDKPSW